MAKLRFDMLPFHIDSRIHMQARCPRLATRNVFVTKSYLFTYLCSELRTWIFEFIFIYIKLYYGKFPTSKYFCCTTTHSVVRELTDIKEKNNKDIITLTGGSGLRMMHLGSCMWVSQLVHPVMWQSIYL